MIIGAISYFFAVFVATVVAMSSQDKTLSNEEYWGRLRIGVWSFFIYLLIVMFAVTWA